VNDRSVLLCALATEAHAIKIVADTVVTVLLHMSRSPVRTWISTRSHMYVLHSKFASEARV